MKTHPTLARDARGGRERRRGPLARAGGLLAAALVPLLGACATNPATGGSMLSLVSRSEEIQMGQEYKQQVEAQMGIYDDPGLNAYVDSVGKVLAATSERPDLPWSFEIVDEPVINAFALPGGPIFVARGLMAAFNSEAEMASVLGHEIGHVTARHSVEQMSRQRLAQFGLAAGSILSSDVARYGQELSAGLQLAFLKFSRDDEMEADGLGFRYMTRAGYDPEQAVEMFQILERQQAESGGGVPAWTSTHPDPGNRVQHAETRIDSAGIRTGAVDRDRYLRRIDGLVYGPDPRQGYFLEQRFVQPELKIELTFPEGWKTQNTPTAVVGVSPQQDAILALTFAEGTSPEDAAHKFFSQDGVTETGGTRRTVNGLSAWMGTFAAQTQQGELRGLVMFVAHDGKIYRVMGYTPAGSIGRYSSAMERTMGSFAPVSDRRLLTVEPKRIDIVQVPSTMTLGEFERRYPSTVPESEVAFLNGLHEGDTVEAGQLLKRVVGTGGPSR